MKKGRRVDLDTVGIGRIFLIAITRRVTAGATFRLIWTVLRYFFYPQFQTRFRPKTRPVVAVDHPLDETIPFKPEHVNLYLTFVHIWIKSCRFIYSMFGKKALPHIRDFEKDLVHLYRDAAAVYLTCQSTTARPNYKKNIRFRIIHLLDPHLHCVPSLHIMIVVFNYYRMRRIINVLNTEGCDCSREIRWMHDKAVSISESVLFVKQHSVNCIPAAFFALTHLLDDFGPEDVHEFTDKFFTIIGQDLGSKQEIRSYFREKYDDFMAQKQNGDSPHKIILKFLEKYSQESVQN
ncbi:MAG: hypothetical protein JW874_05630 [Spirochaetales bacterium]|nr:hypothetical protein [Spirochaetales bacterium]